MKTPFDASPFFISVTAYYALSLPEYHMPMHTHDSCEIMYVTSGCCQVYSEDGVHALTANQFIFLSANTPHRLEISAGRSCAILNLEFNCLGRKQTELPLRELLECCPGFATWLEAGHTCLIAEDQRNLGYAMKDLITQLPLAQDDGPELMRLLFFQNDSGISLLHEALPPGTGRRLSEKGLLLYRAEPSRDADCPFDRRTYRY